MEPLVSLCLFSYPTWLKKQHSENDNDLQKGKAIKSKKKMGVLLNFRTKNQSFQSDWSLWICDVEKQRRVNTQQNPADLYHHPLASLADASILQHSVVQKNRRRKTTTDLTVKGSQNASHVRYSNRKSGTAPVDYPNTLVKFQKRVINTLNTLAGK